MNQFEGFLSGYKDARLYYQLWSPTKTPRALILLTHGHGEHSGSYHRFLSGIADADVQVMTWDWRGHGRSSGHRGFAEHFDEYLYDYELVLKLAQTIAGARPLILLGHSMGGLIQLKSFLSTADLSIKAQILSSPLLGISKNVPLVKDLGAIVLKNFLPQVTLWNEIKDEDLTSEAEIMAEYKKDVLRHAKIAPGVYLGSLEAMEFVKARADRISVPTLIQIPQEDLVVSSAKTREFAGLVHRDTVSLIEYKNSRHEIFNDIEREQVYSDIKKFLDQILSSS